MINEMKEFTITYSVNVHVPAHSKDMAIKKAQHMLEMLGKDKMTICLEESE
jgi:hypothetical protein